MLIYDVEIIQAIPPKDPTKRLDGIQYCDGWTDHANMGVSVIGCYDYEKDQYRVFCEDNFPEFISLVNDHSIVVGFNNLKFDNCLLKATGIIDIQEEKTYDILQEIWSAAGGRFAPSSLDAVCKANFGTSKSGNGALAPVDWQRGNIGAVIDYCLQDIFLTKQIMDRVLGGFPLVSPKNGLLLNLRAPKNEQ